jgi:hypothetical protein
MTHAALLVALLAAPSGVAADTTIAREKTGQGLLDLCEKYEFHVKPDGSAEIKHSDVACHYYMVGFLDAFGEYQSALQRFAQEAPIVFGRLHTVYDDNDKDSRPVAASLTCLPDGVSYDQIVRVVVKYLQSHPERLHRRGKGLAVEALSAAFPCPKAK